MNLHLAAISADVAPGHPAALLLDHCCDTWNKLEAQPWRIMSIGIREWANRF